MVGRRLETPIVAAISIWIMQPGKVEPPTVMDWTPLSQDDGSLDLYLSDLTNSGENLPEELTVRETRTIFSLGKVQHTLIFSQNH